DAFTNLLARIDAFLADPSQNFDNFITEERSAVPDEELKKAQRVAGIIAEPIQGEGGIQVASGRFFRRLRVLTKIFDVPLIFDEVQTGFGATGRLWAHERFDLPSPPDVVTWAKKAQNGVLFVSDALASFFAEEKKFNTTWAGDSAGMARFLAMMNKLDLAAVERTGQHARKGLDALAREYPSFIQNVRGEGIMLGFDVARADWRDELRDRALRNGLILLGCGERSLRFYSRYDTPQPVIDEALTLLKKSIDDVLADKPANVQGTAASGDVVAMLLSQTKIREIEPANFAQLKSGIMGVEKASYGSINRYPPDVQRVGRRPLLQYPADALETSISNARSIGIALCDQVTGRVIAYALGSPLENYDEAGVRDDPHYGESNTFYLQAMAVHPSVQNPTELVATMFDQLKNHAEALGFEHFSTFIEADVVAKAPQWLSSERTYHETENYLNSGIRFVYVRAPLKSP
ncbi:MAG: aminotransferase class III-fold pyridoxal phosphate-dependent enzyme, partial [Deltaproteobacteria bacterium]|nr:aminotransferase class III-fold pyridoxal phosphate-dependent enzyme [Deltaproteobacteria bacterium]